MNPLILFISEKPQNKLLAYWYQINVELTAKNRLEMSNLRALKNLLMILGWL